MPIAFHLAQPRAFRAPGAPQYIHARRLPFVAGAAAELEGSLATGAGGVQALTAPQGRRLMDAQQKVVAPAPVARVPAADGAAHALQRLVALAVPGVARLAMEAMRFVPAQPVRFQAGHPVLLG
ncbi:hypothetical protein D3C72_1698400 [compost metagenome]